MSHELNVVFCTIEFLNDKQMVYTKYMYTFYKFIVVWYMSGNLLLFVITVRWQNSNYVHLSKHNSFSLFQFLYDTPMVPLSIFYVLIVLQQVWQQ